MSQPDTNRRLDQLHWDEAYARDLPADPSTDPGSRTVTGAGFSWVEPSPASAPATLGWSREVADLLGLDETTCESADFAAVFSGARMPEGAHPYAMAYGGHQFGHWAGQLGDGRAMVLGTVRDRDGGRQVLQLKGAGRTPYSRFADGRAVLRSSLREYLCSEAMHHLGIPTTRALSLVLTGDEVVRDMLYDGHPAAEPGAVTCRVSPSFVRFGSFELPASRNDRELLGTLVEHVLEEHFPALLEEAGGDVVAAVPAFFAEVAERTAALIVDWMRVGFVHGVMNTDNLSILGLTIDFGPYGWLENFDPGWTPNTTDAQMRRYRYGDQAKIALWNLLQLANALTQLTRDPEPLQVTLDAWGARYEERFHAMVAERLGWGEWRDGDEERFTSLVDLLVRSEADHVRWHRQLADVPTALDASDDDLLAPLDGTWYRADLVEGELRGAWVAWLRDWARRARDSGLDDDARRVRMDAVNPRYVLRNWVAQLAIDAAEAGDPSELAAIHEVLRRPYEDQSGDVPDRIDALRPEW
ncbi:MAG: hypothetical protein JWM86_684, partial [Thermoleophilia bacterium]|nr:hypothetical protein [Thermoleophilia bacterium]